MYPTLLRVGGWGVPTHEVFVVLGVAAALIVFAVESRRRGVADRAMWTIAGGALFGGAVFAIVLALFLPLLKIIEQLTGG